MYVHSGGCWFDLSVKRAEQTVLAVAAGAERCLTCIGNTKSHGTGPCLPDHTPPSPRATASGASTDFFSFYKCIKKQKVGKPARGGGEGGTTEVTGAAKAPSDRPRLREKPRCRRKRVPVSRRRAAQSDLSRTGVGVLQGTAPGEQANSPDFPN